MDVAQRGIKTFAATVCVGEPPDVEYVLDTSGREPSAS